MKLQSVYFQNFPIFHDWEPSLDHRITVVMGGQAKGKTKVLDAIFTATKAARDILQPPRERASPEKLFHLESNEYSFGIKGIHNKIEFDSKVTWTPDNPQFDFTSREDCKYEELLNQTQRLSFLEYFRHPYHIDKWDLIREIYLYSKSQPLTNAEFLAYVRNGFALVFPEVDLGLISASLNDTEIKVDNLAKLSNGQIQVLNLFWRIYTVSSYTEGRQGIVLIDDLETYLDPKSQERIPSALIRTFPHVQFIISTSSPMIYNGAYNSRTLRLEDLK